jgi:DNA-binding CsgD family transcriptional regulator
MATDLGTLTDREKAVLRLLAKGFDTKSAARELGLSVHTVNERLRSTRRKLRVTSSREAARLLLEQEDNKSLVYKKFGVGYGAEPSDSGATSKRAYAPVAGGLIAMSLIFLTTFLTLRNPTSGIIYRSSNNSILSRQQF